MNIDIHSHFIPHEFIDLIPKDPSLQAGIVQKGNQPWIAHEQGYTYPLLPGFYDTKARLKYMDEAKLDLSLLSVAPPLFYYWVSPEVALKVAKMANNSIKEAVSAYPDRLRGAATVPMQDIDLAVTELCRCVQDLGFKAVQIGCNIEGQQLDDPTFLPFFKACEEVGAIVLLHPYYVGAKGAFANYYLTNFYGNPLDSAMAVASLIFGGVFDKYPKLKVCVAHGGGFFPYQAGRLEHGYKVRQEPKVNGCNSPRSYLTNLYFDSILFDEKSLRFLVDFAGYDHVLLGTDYPFDMGESAPVQFVQKAGLTAKQVEFVLGKNAELLFNL